MSGSEVGPDLFEGLLNEDAAGEPIPVVATQLGGFGRRADLYLHPCATTPNGRMVTGHRRRFRLSWRRAADPAHGVGIFLVSEGDGLENAGAFTGGEWPPDQLGVRAIDDLTLEVTIDAPRPYFPQMTTLPDHLPAAPGDDRGAWRRLDPARATWCRTRLCADRLRSAERLVRERNEIVLDNDNTINRQGDRADHQRRERRPDPLPRGELDMTEGAHRPVAAPVAGISRPGDQLSQFLFLLLPVQPFRQRPRGAERRAVRQALSMAVDRDVIVNNILAAVRNPPTPLPTGPWRAGNSPRWTIANMTQDERNEKRARELITEAGYGIGGDPLTFEILYNTSMPNRSIANGDQPDVETDPGRRATLANQEWSTYLDKPRQPEFRGRPAAAWCADTTNPAQKKLSGPVRGNSATMTASSSTRPGSLMAEAKTAGSDAAVSERSNRSRRKTARDHPDLPLRLGPDDERGPGRIFPTENFLQNWYSKDLYISAGENNRA